MKIYHYDLETGAFLGEGTADESPLEPGVFLIPRGAVAGPHPGTPPEGHYMRLINGVWEAWIIPATPEEPTVPQKTEAEILTEWRESTVVSRFQARAALHLAGLLEQVETYMSSPDTPILSKLAWQDAQEFRRMSPTVLALAAMLGLSEEALDKLFMDAKEILA